MLPAAENLDYFLSTEKLGFIVGVAGLILAIWAVYAAKATDKRIKKLDATTENLNAQLRSANEIIKEMSGFVKDTRSALSTSHIGPFPDFMKDISKALEAATNSVKILIDHPGYGSISNPIEHSNIFREIDKFRNATNINVQIMFSNEASRISSLETQFKDQDIPAFLQTMKVPATKLIEEYNLETNKNITIENCTREDLIAAATVRNNNLAKQYLRFRGARELEAPNNYLFVWIIDQQLAIFSVPGFDAKSAELGFKTSDKRLIEALEKVFDRNWEESMPFVA